MAKSPCLLPFFQFLAVLFLTFYSIFQPSVSLTLETQALFQFKNHLKDSLNYLASWNESDSPCEFYGITCDQVSGRVTEISLGNKSLSGIIFPSLSVLQSLQVFSLPSNLISEKLPAEISRWTNLRVLNLSGNQLVGAIPDFSGLRNLQILDLSANYFSGSIPSWVGNLTGLVSLVLGENAYNEGEIPGTLGNLKNLTWLYLAGSHLIGEIPESLYDMKALETLDISRNKISGRLSRSISKLENLYKIELFKNNLTGEVPAELANLTNLQEIDLSSNNMYGRLPEEIGNMKNLVVFQLYENRFSGELPVGFADMRHLNGFSIYRNSFTGTIPENFGRFSALESIDISENQFSGDFPKFLCERNKLKFLLALQNNFSGTFPESYVTCKSLERFRISMNQLSGKIPDKVWALPYVEIIDLAYNDFTGVVPSEIGLSTSLSQLVLTQNRFSGKLPSELGKLVNLEKLYLSNNNFSGEIPPEIGSLKQLSSLHVEVNSLTGSIPPELGHCARLVDLNLAWNSLSGNIPQSISLMSSLNSLNISGNKLTGSIPDNLEAIKLSSVDFSENLLSGRIPSGLFIVGGEKAFLGNKGLCFEGNLKPSLNSDLKICAKNHGQSRVTADKFVFLFLIASIFVVILACLLLLSCRSLKRGAENNMQRQREISQKWKLASFHQVDIDADEICNLDEDNLIGSGGTGKVYRVELRKNRNNEGLFVGAAGLLGLGGGKLSFPAQVNATSFSYCLVDRDSDAVSTLEFDSPMPRNAVIAPLMRNPELDTFYYLGLKGISVGGETLQVPESSFAVDATGGGGIIVDSGTAVTRLRSEVYDALRDAFVRGTKGLPKTNGVSLFDTCYDLSSRNSVDVPTVSLHFPEGRELPLPAKNYLIPVDSVGTFCFAFAPTTSSLSIIGNVQQQGTRVSFDIGNSLVGFSANSC